MRKKKFVPKGVAKTLGTLCAKLEAAKSRPTKAKRKSAKGAKRKSAKSRKSPRKSVRKSARRDASYGASRTPVKKRAVKRPVIRSAAGPWVFRDPAWFGEPRRHAKAAKKGIRNSPKRKAGIRRAAKKSSKSRRSAGGRDPSWFGDSARHSAAARFGWGQRFGPENIRTHARPLKDTPSEIKYGRLGPNNSRTKVRGRRDPAWYGESERHAFSAEKGWRRVAKPGWTPKRYNPKGEDSRDPSHFGRVVRSAKGRRPTKSPSKRGSRGRARNSSGQFLPARRRDY